jgi:hypothetical protein
LNVTTLENQELTVELSSAGFRIVSTNGHDVATKNSTEEESVFETPYSLLDSISPAYVQGPMI